MTKNDEGEQTRGRITKTERRLMTARACLKASEDAEMRAELREEIERLKLALRDLHEELGQRWVDPIGNRVRSKLDPELRGTVLDTEVKVERSVYVRWDHGNAGWDSASKVKPVGEDER